MKKLIMLVFATIAIDSWAWNSLAEMEDAICVAVTNNSATEANAMVASGAVTNRPVFSCSGTPLTNRNASQDDVWLSLAKYVPAISSPIGGCAAFGNPDRAADLNSSSYRNGWGRTSSVYGASWLHSDMKDMSYYHVYPLYDEIVQKGGLK